MEIIDRILLLNKCFANINKIFYFFEWMRDLATGTVWTDMGNESKKET